jgi:hypothetical protein
MLAEGSIYVKLLHPGQKLELKPCIIEGLVNRLRIPSADILCTFDTAFK